jgi:hypothetical protein
MSSTAGSFFSRDFYLSNGVYRLERFFMCFLRGPASPIFSESPHESRKGIFLYDNLRLCITLNFTDPVLVFLKNTSAWITQFSNILID